MNIHNKTILVVDDTTENLNILKNILEKDNFDVFLSKDGEKAVKIAQEILPDLILLDILMPNIDGYETCKRMKNNEKTKDIPIIFLSALTSPNDKVKAFEVGGVDYIPKPFHEQEVLVRVKSHLQTSMIISSLNNLVEKSFHEIYTPLSVMSTGLEMQVLEHGNTNYLKSIKSAMRLLNIFSDDMYYSIKKEVTQFEPQWIELEPFMKEQINYLLPIALNNEMDFELKSNIDNPMILISEIELKRVVLNILSNALKYGYKNSTINIKIDMKEEGFISFSISNRGKILSNPDKIFEKLYQENSDSLGFGIGLDIVASICKKNDIEINVTSINNKTKFKFTYKEKK